MKENLESIMVENHLFTPEAVINALSRKLTPKRRSLFERVISNRTKYLVPLLESIHDTGNINAVIRTCENFGVYHLGNIPSESLKTSSRITQGAHKWTETKNFLDTAQAFSYYRNQGYKIATTALHENAVSLDELPVDGPLVVLFGNEKDGASEYAKENSDYICQIPTVGFTQSFNISVAAAITISSLASRIPSDASRRFLSKIEQDHLYARYLIKHFKKHKNLSREIRNHLDTD